MAMAVVANYWQKLLTVFMVVHAPRMLHAGRVTPSPRWAMTSHAHDFHELIVILRGMMHVRGSGFEADCGEGDVLLYPAGVIHDERSARDDPVETIFLSFQAGEMLPCTIVRLVDGRGRVRDMARWIYEDRLATDARRRASLQALGAALFAELSVAPREKADPIVDEIRTWVQRNLREHLTLDVLALRAGLSRYHFLRRYKQAAGRTPMQDVRVIRLDHARSLLLGTGLPLKDIAALAGLGDEYTLSRLFRRMLGMSPRSLRRHQGRVSS